MSEHSRAHEVEPFVQINTQILHDAKHLTVAVQVPLTALRDVEFPVTDDNHLKMPGALPALNHAAQLWLINEATFFAHTSMFTEGRPLENPEVLALTVSTPATKPKDLLNPGPSRVNTVWQHLDLTVVFRFALPASSTVSFESSWHRLGIRTRTNINYASANDQHHLAINDQVERIHLAPSRIRVLVAGLRNGPSLSTYFWFLTMVAIGLHWRPQPFHYGLFSLVFIATVATSAFFTGLPGWAGAALVIALSATIIWFSLENVLGINLTQRQNTAMISAIPLGASLGLDLQSTLQFAGAHTLLVCLSTGLSVLVLLMVTGAIAWWIWFRIDARMQTPRKNVLAWIIALALVHTAWHKIETSWQTASAYLSHIH